jgi:hypothetical protein
MPSGSARLFPAFMVLTLVLGVSVWISRPTPISASTESSMTQTILTLLNRDRAARGLVGLRPDTRLGGLATNRAQWMASAGTLSHDSYGGSVDRAVAMVGISAWSSAEAVGSTNAAFGTAAATYLYGLWRDSPEHLALMMSTASNYIGVGVGFRSATGETYSSLVFAEAPDSSRPVARMTGAASAGHTVSFTWIGRDGQLQTHTAGLRDFDVQYRVDAGAWATIETHTTSTRLILANRPAGHTYSVRNRDRDRRNNLSVWSSPRTVRV